MGTHGEGLEEGLEVPVEGRAPLIDSLSSGCILGGQDSVEPDAGRGGSLLVGRSSERSGESIPCCVHSIEVSISGYWFSP